MINESQKIGIGEWFTKNWHFIVFFIGMFVTWGTVTQKVNTLTDQVSTINQQVFTLNASVAELKGNIDIFVKTK